MPIKILNFLEINNKYSDKTEKKRKKHGKRILCKRVNCSPNLSWALRSGDDGNGCFLRCYRSKKLETHKA